MNDIDKLKTKRRLKSVHFDFPEAHVAYTEESQGGACSLLNDPILLKSLDGGKKLTANQKALLLKFGVTESDMEKSLSVDEQDSGLSSPTLGDSAGEQPETIQKGNEDNMSAELIARLEASEKAHAALVRELAVQKAVNTLTKYGFEAGVSKSLADALASLDAEAQVSVIKALDVVVAEKEAAVTKAVEIEKAATKVGEVENPIAKALSEEAGHGEKVEAPVEKSFTDKVKEETEARISARFSQGAK